MIDELASTLPTQLEERVRQDLEQLCNSAPAEQQRLPVGLQRTNDGRIATPGTAGAAASMEEHPAGAAKPSRGPTFWADEAFQRAGGGRVGQDAYDSIIQLPVSERETAFRRLHEM